MLVSPSGNPPRVTAGRFYYTVIRHFHIMATTFTWGINTLERETSDGFVITAHYTINANDDVYTAGAYGSIGFERPDTLIPFDDLTEEQVIGWVQTALGGEEKVDEIQEALQKQLNEKHAPTVQQGTPWAA